MKALFILSIVIPVGVLTTFRLTGILEGPPAIREIITLEDARWEFERPTFPMPFKQKIETLYNDDLSLNQSVFVDVYWPDVSEYGGSSKLTMLVGLTATLTVGHIENVNVTFHDDYLDSQVRLLNLEFGGKPQPDLYGTVWKNLSLMKHKDFFDLRGSTEKAFIDFRGENRPESVLLSIVPVWILRSPINQTQQLTIRLEVTYFNGTAYKKVVQPFGLRLVADNNNSFKTAVEIQFGQFETKSFLGGDDKQDFYKILLERDDAIHVAMTPPSGEDFDLFCYDEAGNLIASSTRRGEMVESIDYQADSTSWLFIKVQVVNGWGVYTLSVSPFL